MLWGSPSQTFLTFLFLSHFTAMLPLQLGLPSNFLKNWPCFYPFHQYHLVLSHHSLPVVSVFAAPFSLQKPEGDFQLSSHSSVSNPAMTYYLIQNKSQRSCNGLYIPAWFVPSSSPQYQVPLLCLTVTLLQPPHLLPCWSLDINKHAPTTRTLH